MGTGSFSILSTSQDIIIDPLSINGKNNVLNYVLTIPVTFLLHGIGEKRKFVLEDLYTELEIEGIVITDRVFPFNGGVEAKKTGHETKVPSLFTYYLNEDSMAVLESKRKGDIIIRLKFTAIGTITDLNSYDSLLKDWKFRDSGSVDILVPRSHWIESILANMKFRHFRLIEVPILANDIPKEYDDILTAFNEAERHFKNQDYALTVSDCRIVIDKINKSLQRIREEGHNNSSLLWLSKIAQESLDFIKGVKDANMAITSKRHHIISEHPKYEAESIYLVTLGLMNYVGHLFEIHK